MADHGFVVTGARAPSSLSSYQPHSAASRHGYHILATKSSVDELLFRSNQPARLNETTVNFKAPWEYPKPQPPPHSFGKMKQNEMKSKPQGRPLLWCPTPGTAIHTRDKIKIKSHRSTDCLWSTRDHFRHLKHTPSFTDESLFGPKLEEPSFEAPWNIRKNRENKQSKPFALDASQRNVVSARTAAPALLVSDSNTSFIRPATALGTSRSKGKVTCVTTTNKPVWKP